MSAEKSIKEIKAEALQVIYDRIPDENLRKIIFGEKAISNPREIFSDSEHILEHVTRILTVVFHFVYFRYRKWTIEDNVVDDGPKDNDLIRIFKVLKRLYLIHSLSYEIMESILMDLQIDIALNGNIARELRIGSEINQNPEYSKMTYLAKWARNHARSNENTSLRDRIGDFVRFTNNFPFLLFLESRDERIDNAFLVMGQDRQEYPLWRVRWNYTNPFNHCDIDSQADSYSGEIDKDPYGGEIDSYYSIISTPTGPFFLESVEFIRKDTSNDTVETLTGNDIIEDTEKNHLLDNVIGLKLNYAPFQPNSSYLQAIVGEDECLFDERFGKEFIVIRQSWKEVLIDNFPDFTDVLSSEVKPLIEDFYSINYKYIRNLALAIVDVLTPDDQARIAAHYTKDSHYQSLFIAKSGELASLHWDVIIAILMVEEGAGKILQLIFNDNRQAFSSLMRNLELRFGSDHFPRNKLLKNTQQEIEKGVQQFRERNPLQDDSFFYNAVRVSVQVRTIVANVTKAVNGNEIINEKIDFPISIRSYIQLIQGIRDDVATSLRKKLLATRATVIQALGTLIRYYRAFFRYAKVKKEFETESYYYVMTDEQIIDYQKRAQAEYEKEREIYRVKLSEVGNNYSAVMGILKELCDDCTLGSEFQQLLQYSLGRQQILDFEFLNSILSVFELSVEDDPEEDFVEHAIDCTLEAFHYLQSGERKTKGNKKTGDDSREKKAKDLSMKAIFPFVATYQYSKQTGDGYHINHFSLISPKGREITVKVMSEFHYTLNEKYYCLPNKQSSANALNLWIEPIMIKYQNKESEE